MLLILNAILPIFVVILIGWGFRINGFPSDRRFWDGADKFIYFILLPCLFFRTAATTSISLSDSWPVPVSMVITAMIFTLFMLLTKPLYRTDDASFTSLFQGSIRFNGYLSIAVVQGLYGSDAMGLVAVSFGILIPVVNILAVMVLAKYGERETPVNWRGVLYHIVTNPMVFSSVGGLLFNLSGLTLPHLLSEPLKILGDAALGCGLLAVGANLQFKMLNQVKFPAVVSCVYKLLLFPLATAIVAYLLGVRGLELQITAILAALPNATASYLLARRMGGNVELMAGIIVAQIMAAAATLPLVIYVAQHY